MNDTERPFSPGLTATILGSTGLLLFFLPIIGAPASAVGLLVAAFGAVYSYRTGQAHLRWTLAGLLVCSLALAVNLAMAFGPIDLVPSYLVAPQWQPIHDAPYVAPPSLPLN